MVRLNTRKKHYFKVKYLFIFLIAVLLIFIVCFWVKPNRIKSIFKDSIICVSNVLRVPIDYLGDGIKSFNSSKGLLDDNRILNNKIRGEENLKAVNEELQGEVDRLSRLLELNQTMTDFTLINATIKNRNFGYWYDFVTIDKGSNDGITDGLAVINSEGLVGITDNVSGSNSDIKLLTNKNFMNKISVKIKRDGHSVYGILSGYDEKNGVYIINGITDNSDIAPEALVITTGYNEGIPLGLVVGHVSSESADNFDLARVVYVRPSVSSDSIDYVSVVKSND